MCPFVQWDFDLVGQFIPPSSGDHKFIIMVMKYFTKWVEIKSLELTIGLKIANFI